MHNDDTMYCVNFAVNTLVCALSQCDCVISVRSIAQECVPQEEAVMELRQCDYEMWNRVGEGEACGKLRERMNIFMQCPSVELQGNTAVGMSWF